MMTDSYSVAAGVQHDIVRLLFSTLDRPLYGFLGVIYRLFFNVASADLFANDTMMKFYGRVQLILGVFMMFQLAMIILKGIMNPDSFTDSKSGVGNLIMRIATALFLLTSLVPISIPAPKNEYEIQINNNGLLFGTLYSLQHRLLSNNTLGRLILGTTETSENYVSLATTEEESLKESSRIFTATILKGFYRINLLPEDDLKDIPECVSADDPATKNACRMCQSGVDAQINAYKKLDANSDDIIAMVNETCDFNSSILNVSSTLSYLSGNKRYVFTYSPVLSTITAVVFIFILLSFTVDVAVRAVKLAVLRLISPIPIISYIDPKGTKDGAFNSWVKTLTSTYLDLFLRLAIVYFVLFLIQDMMVNGIVIKHGTGLLGIISLIVIWIGLFIFAKQAPKFIKQVLGLKDSDFKFMSGFGEIGSAIGLAAAVPGAIGSGIASARASRMADETRESFGEKDIFGNPVNPKSALNKGKHLLAGIAGGFSGGAAGAKAALTAKEHGFNSSIEAMRKRNADALARGNDGSTLFGRIGSAASNVFMGEGRADATARTIETNKGRIDALKAIKSRVTGEMVKKDWTHGNLGIATDNDGNAIGDVNFKEFEARLAAGRADGSGVVTFNDYNGVSHTINIGDAEKQRGFLLKNNENNYIEQHVQGTVSAADRDNRLVTLIHNAEVLGGSSDFTRDADGTITKGANKHITDRNSVNDAIDAFEDYNTQLNRENAINKANDKFSGNKK